MLEALSHFIIQFIHNTSYAGIFVLMGLESALIPIPSEVTMPFSGFLASQGSLNLWMIIVVGTIANLVGSLVAYYLGFFLQEKILLKFIHKYGKFILITEKEYNHASHWFEKYGDKVIFISRLLPAVRTIISLPAGVFRMDIKKFTFYTVLGCLIWSVFLTYVGFYLGENWASLEGYYRKFEYVIVALLVIGISIYLYKKLELGKKLRKA